jgi:hypothetical protein
MTAEVIDLATRGRVYPMLREAERPSPEFLWANSAADGVYRALEPGGSARATLEELVIAVRNEAIVAAGLEPDAPEVLDVFGDPEDADYVIAAMARELAEHVFQGLRTTGQRSG